MTLDDAYRHCERVTRSEAANFYYGIRLLPRRRRQSMCAVYAFARRVDDIGDGTLSPEEKLAALDQQARDLALVELAGGAPVASEDPVVLALADSYARFHPPADALHALIEGVRMDVRGVEYESFEDLVLYCRRVAGAIGRICLAIFAVRTEETQTARAEGLADDLGVALQLTNILRDLREDADNGRVYIPREALARFGLLPEDPGTSSAEHVAAAIAGGEQLPAFSALVAFEAARAREWFDRGMTLVELLDRRSGACVLAMAGIYRRLLARIEADPAAAVRARQSLPAHEKAWVAARALLGVRA